MVSGFTCAKEEQFISPGWGGTSHTDFVQAASKCRARHYPRENAKKKNTRNSSKATSKSLRAAGLSRASYVPQLRACRSSAGDGNDELGDFSRRRSMVVLFTAEHRLKNGEGAGGGLSQGTSVTASGHMTCRFPALYPSEMKWPLLQFITPTMNCKEQFVTSLLCPTIDLHVQCRSTQFLVVSGAFWAVPLRFGSSGFSFRTWPAAPRQITPATAHILRSVTVLYDGWLGCVGFKGCCIQSQTTASAELSSKAAGFPSSGT